MPDFRELLVIFANIVFEALPFIVVGALISGVMEELLPQQAVARLIPKNRILAIAGSALLGMVFPMCECGIVPVMRRLLGKGLPLACAVAYMLAAPIINLVVIGSTVAAFYNPAGSREDGLTSGLMVSLRVGLAFIVACVAGTVVSFLERRRGQAALIQPIFRAGHSHDHQHDHGHSHQHDDGHGHSHHDHEHAHAHDHAKELDAKAVDVQPDTNGEPVKEVVGVETESTPLTQVHDVAAAPELQKKTVWQRISSICETALHDFVDITCFLVLGAFLAALVQSSEAMKPFMAQAENDYLAVPVMMLLAILLCLCSEADAFVAANLIKVPLAGKIAFLVLGPMLDLKLFFMYTRVFKYRLIWTIVITVITCVFILSMATGLIDKAVRATSAG